LKDVVKDTELIDSETQRERLRQRETCEQRCTLTDEDIQTYRHSNQTQERQREENREIGTWHTLTDGVRQSEKKRLRDLEFEMG